MATCKPARGGRGGYEPRARVATRQARAWELSIVGRTQREIAQELGVTQPAVAKMLQRAAAAQSRALTAETRTHVVRHAAQADHLYREMMNAWEKSKTDQTRRRHRRVEHDGSAVGEGGTTTLVEASALAREGDPRFAGHALRALGEKRALLERVAGGTAVPPTVPDDPYAAMERKLMRMPTGELCTIRGIKDKQLMWSEAAREIFQSLSPEELMAFADIMKKDRDGAYDEPNDQ